MNDAHLPKTTLTTMLVSIVFFSTFNLSPALSQVDAGDAASTLASAFQSGKPEALKAALGTASEKTLLASLHGGYAQTDMVLRELYQRMPREDDSLVRERERASAAITILITDTGDARMRLLGLRYWRVIAGGKVKLPDALVAVIFDHMLGDTSNVGPSDKMPDVPQEIATDVLSIEVERFEPRLLAMLDRDSSADRLAAIRVFAKCPEISERATLRLIEQLRKESDESAASELATAFGHFNFRQDDAVKLLLDHLDQPANEKGNAARSIGFLAPELSDGIRSAAADAFFEQQTKKTGGAGRWALISLRVLIVLLPEEQQKEMVDQLIPLAKQPSEFQSHRLSIIAEVGTKGAAAIPLLKTLMAENEADEKARLAGFLWAVEENPDSVLPIFSSAILSDDSVERHYGLEGLERMQGAAAPAIPGLVKLLSSEKLGTRVSALRCLRDLGPFASSALAAVEGLSESEIARERRAAEEAVAAIRAEKSL